MMEELATALAQAHEEIEHLRAANEVLEDLALSFQSRLQRVLGAQPPKLFTPSRIFHLGASTADAAEAAVKALDARYNRRPDADHDPGWIVADDLFFSGAPIPAAMRVWTVRPDGSAVPRDIPEPKPVSVPPKPVNPAVGGAKPAFEGVLRDSGKPVMGNN